MTGEGSAPASSANLGPGFDILGLALDVRCSVKAHRADSWSVDSDRGDPDEATMFALEAVTAPGAWHLQITSTIPVARGLGSSAALLAAAAAATRRWQGGVADPDEVFTVVAEAEGHPDNAAATVYGGLVAVTGGSVHQLELSPDLVAVLAVPNQELSTTAARAVLPDEVPSDVVARSVTRVAFLIEGMRTADPVAFAAAAGDELHEPYRAALAPITSVLMDAARGAGALHVCWSGAGPSILAVVTVESRDAVVEAMGAVLGTDGEVLMPAMTSQGLL